MPGMEPSTEKLRGLRITSLDEEDDEAELAHQPPPAVAPSADYEDGEEDDEEPEVVLGFLEKPKCPGLLRHLFPSKTGGIPVRATTRSY
jgi:pre-rRNA-processing protein TSR4